MPVVIPDPQLQTVSQNPVNIPDPVATFFPIRQSDLPSALLSVLGELSGNKIFYDIFYVLLTSGWGRASVTLETLSEQYLSIANLVAVDDKTRFHMLEIIFGAVRQHKLERTAFEAGPRDDEPQHLSERFSASSVETLAVNPTVLSFSDPTVLSVSDSSAISRAREANGVKVDDREVKRAKKGSFFFVANNQEFRRCN
jgi:hypothetical protein